MATSDLVFSGTVEKMRQDPGALVITCRIKSLYKGPLQWTNRLEMDLIQSSSASKAPKIRDTLVFFVVHDDELCSYVHVTKELLVQLRLSSQGKSINFIAYFVAQFLRPPTFYELAMA